MQERAAMGKLELNCLDHFIRATPDIEAAYKAVTQLGLTAMAPTPMGDTGAHYSVVTVGGPRNPMFVEYMTYYDLSAVRADSATADVVPLLEAGGGMYNVVFPLGDLTPARDVFGDEPGGFTERVTLVADGALEVRTLTPADTSVSGCHFGFVEYPATMAGAMDQVVAPVHDFPLKRVDHIAMVPPDLDAGTRYWTDVLGVPLHAEIQGPGFVIRQMKVGDLMVELLGSTDPSGPLADTPPGLLPVLACEVDDVAACAELARQRGFTPPDPAPGILPGTLVTTIPATETGGIQYQLLQYV
jgi:catechol 2,3-dioxygenase-like lactoylglutathione lyase family enzyme